jgi:hypothetical protein
MRASMSWNRGLSAFVLLAGLSGFFWMRGCNGPLPPIEVTDGMVHVRNVTDEEWRNVRIWVNDYYAVTVVSIPPAGFVREPVRRFVAAQGQTINTSTTTVSSVVVIATGTESGRVRVAWGKPAMH